MNKYPINKGIGRTVEFQGLKSQYLYFFAGGLLSILVLIMVFYLTGVNAYLCLLTGIGSASLLVWKVFALNRKYGEHGLMKLGAKRKHPRFIICRRPLRHYVKLNPKPIR